jgi:hypothetical protein
LAGPSYEGAAMDIFQVMFAVKAGPAYLDKTRHGGGCARVARTGLPALYSLDLIAMLAEDKRSFAYYGEYYHEIRELLAMGFPIFPLRPRTSVAYFSKGNAMTSGISAAERAALAAALVTAWTNGSTGSELKLYQNNFTPTPMSALGDFVEATFTGYAAKTALITWRTYNDALDGSQIIDQTILQLFAAGAITSPQTVYGWYLTDGTAAVLQAWGTFDVPYTFSANGDKLSVNPYVKLLTNVGQSNG